MSNAVTLPVWSSLESLSQECFQAPDGIERVDVAVIGAGIAGLATALNLVDEGRHVVVFDRDGFGAGESLRTTAHLASALDDRYGHLARWHGSDGARLAAASHAAATDWIEAFCTRQDRRCGFRRVPGYLFAHDGDPARLREEYEAAAHAGLKVELLERGLPTLPQLGTLLEFQDQARVDMGRLLEALAEELRARAVSFVRAEVTAVEGGGEVGLSLRSGQRIRAAAAVVASNVPFHEMVAIHTKQAPYRTYVVAGDCRADAVPAMLPDALLWDDGDPYHYLRLREHPERDGRWQLLVGGEDHKTGQAEDPQAYVRLQAWTRRLFPDLVEGFSHAWSGQVLEPVDGLGFIGADAGGADNVYVITGDSGNGVTHGVIGGMLVGDLIVGRPNPWRELYDPARKPVRAAGGWLRENANVVAQYRDWLEFGGGLKDLARGAGTVVRKGLHRVAVYRDGDGALHAFSARCPHLGCAVRWSPQEKSWDCPCHGSRFAARDGTVLNGPANAPLAPFELDPDDAAAPRR